MENAIIGIDISKDTLDVIGLNQQREIVLPPQCYINTPEGISKLLTAIKTTSQKHTWWACLEDTGQYGALLLSMLAADRIQTTVLNPLHLTYSMGMVRGKTDTIDAIRLANYGLTHFSTLVPYSLPESHLRKLKVIMSTRMRMVKLKTSVKNGLKSLEEAAKTLDLEETITQQQALVDYLESLIIIQEKAMLGLVRKTPALNTNYKKIIKVIGVGQITAMMCLIYTDNFTRFKTPRQFNSYCGLAPFAHRSGTSVRKKTKTSPLRNRAMKGILMQAAATAIQHDPQLKGYYRRKLKEGKPKLSVLNAVANKVVLRIFAVQKRNEPFVKMSA